MRPLQVFRPDEPAGPSSVFTITDVIDLYLRHSVAEGTHCPEALAERQRTLGLFAEAYGDLPVTACKPFHLTDWIESHSRWKSPSTRRGKANQVRAAFQWAFEGERIERNPFARVHYAEAERRPDMPDVDLEKIAALGNKPFERAIRFLRLTGCRLGELCRATWVDVDLIRGIWTIQRHKSRRYTQRAKVVALVPAAVDLLLALRPVAIADAQRVGAVVVPVEPAVSGHAPPPPAGLIFLNNRGTCWNRVTLGQQLRRLKTRLGIDSKASLHGIRHRFGSAAVAAGAPLKLVSRQLGHSSVAVTERYYVDLDGEIDAIREAAKLAMPKGNDC